MFRRAGLSDDSDAPHHAALNQASSIGRLRLPDLPDLAHQRRAGLEGDLSGLPARRRHFAGGLDVLEGLDLPDQLVRIAATSGVSTSMARMTNRGQ